jgi:signal transduction histidine kinase
LRSFGHIATLIVAVGVAIAAPLAVILGISAGEVDRKRRQLLDELGATQAALAEDTAHEFGARMDALDRDTRILASLVSRTRQRGRPDVDTENQIILSAFDALVAVVPQYRTIALYDAAGHPSVTAIDPTEDRETIARSLFALGGDLAREIAGSGQSVLRGPTPSRDGNRFFYLLGAPAGAREVIVVTCDAGIFLHSALPLGEPDAHEFVLDPHGVVWKDCKRSAHCSPAPAAELGDVLAGTQMPIRWLDAQETARVGLPPSTALLASAQVASTGGLWTLRIASSAARISERQSALLRQMIITSLAAALAVAAVGVFILRQQRRAAALSERLRTAQEVATLREKSDAIERQLIRTEKILTAGVISAGLAHEIGTPISVIRGRAEHLLETLSAGPPGEDLAVIVRHADRISATIGQVLDFSRAQPIQVGRVEIAATLERTRQLLDWKLTSKGVSLTVALPSASLALLADADQLEQVLVNLIMNACDACDEGGQIRVLASLLASDQIKLDVSDSGCGIPVEHLNAIFDPFFTTKKRGEGTGLGLTVAASIARNHGGSLTVTSGVGQGTTFSLLWPAASEARA